jgi:hypothetical protein
LAKDKYGQLVFLADSDFYDSGDKNKYQGVKLIFFYIRVEWYFFKIQPIKKTNVKISVFNDYQYLILN